MVVDDQCVGSSHAKRGEKYGPFVLSCRNHYDAGVPGLTLRALHAADGRNTERLVGVIGADIKPVRRPFPTPPSRLIPRYTFSRMGADSSSGHIVTGNPFGQVPFQ